MRPLRPMYRQDGSVCCGDEANRGCHCDYHQGWNDALDALDMLTPPADKNVQHATRVLSAALIAVSPLLSDPYPDNSRWSPWTRWVEPALARLQKAAQVQS